MVAPQLIAPGSWGWLSGFLAALRTWKPAAQPPEAQWEAAVPIVADILWLSTRRTSPHVNTPRWGM